MESYTNIEQSKELAKILPPESADMARCGGENVIVTNYISAKKKFSVCGEITITPCWSLTALVNILPFPQLSKDNLGSGRTGWMVSVYPDNCRYDSCWHDNPVDACVDIIIKLNELKLL